MRDDALCWDVEEACLNAWPAARQVLWRGWLLRLAGGKVRRTNSVNPLRAFNYDPRPVLEAAAAIYARNDRPLMFRVPQIATGMDGPLEAMGFSLEGETATLMARLEADASRPRGDFADDIDIVPSPSPEWLALRSRLNGADAAADAAYLATLNSIALPKAFAAARDETGIVSTACGVIDRGFLAIESVATVETARNRGLARRVVAALMKWAQGGDVKAACLQVAADNLPARALYARLGFDTELYRYHYRRAGRS